jgi:glutamyl-Q tRNA(Asp) synthetase
VVDDAAFGINQVVRGADLISSTPRQIYLQRLFGYATPAYAHLPLVTGPAGTKLSKRDNAVSLAAGRDLKNEGGALLLAALRFLGQASPSELHGTAARDVLQWGVEHFNLAAVPRASAPFPEPQALKD